MDDPNEQKRGKVQGLERSVTKISLYSINLAYKLQMLVFWVSLSCHCTFLFLFVFTTFAIYLLCSIYEDIAEYNPGHKPRDLKKSKDMKKDKHNYFEKPVHGERNVSTCL